jgi:hypothetical protein
MYEIAIRFWGSVVVFGLAIAVLGGMLDAILRSARRPNNRDVRFQASACPRIRALVTPKITAA